MSDGMRISEIENYITNMIEGCEKNKTIQTAPIYITSKPGMGKSQLIKSIADKFECPLYDARLAQFAPEDLRGVPYPDIKSKTTEWFTPVFFPRKNELAILFLDELDKAKPAVQNASLQLLLDRKLGEYRLPNKVFVLAAGNTLNDNSFSIPLSSALNNRMFHVDMDMDAKDWIKWASENIGNEKKQISKIEEDIIGFIQFKPQLIHAYNDKERAWPSPRTWEFLSKSIRSYPKVLKDSDIMNLASMVVGKGVSREFHAYRKIYKGIDPKEILKGKFPIMENQNSSYIYAISTCLGFYVKNNGLKNKEQALNCLKFIEKFSEEFRVITLRLMLKRNLLNNKINEWCQKEAESILSPIFEKIMDNY